MRQPHDRALAGVALGPGVTSVALEVTSLSFAHRTTKALGGEIDWAGLVWALWHQQMRALGLSQHYREILSLICLDEAIHIFDDEACEVAGA